MLGKSGSGRLGRAHPRERKYARIEGRRGRHHEQSHGIARGDLSARVAAGRSRRPTSTRTASTCATASPNGCSEWKENGWRTSDRKPVKNKELWERLDRAASGAQSRRGIGSAAMLATRKTSGPTNWHAKACSLTSGAEFSLALSRVHRRSARATTAIAVSSAESVANPADNPSENRAPARSKDSSFDHRLDRARLLLGLRAGDVPKQHRELVSTDTSHDVRGANLRPRQAARRVRVPSRPAAWPKRSLIGLNPSRSR